MHKAMYGAIIGDMVGSIYERSPIRTKDFPFFSRDAYNTCDTVMTVAVYRALKAYEAACDGASGPDDIKGASNAGAHGFVDTYPEPDKKASCQADALKAFKMALIAELLTLGRAYPRAGYGKKFIWWLFGDNPAPYGSNGNGSAMRVSIDR